MQKVIVILILIALSACSTQVKKDSLSPRYEAPLYPEVGLFYTRPDDALQKECDDFGQKSAFTLCRAGHFDLYQLGARLRESGAFVNVGTGKQSEFEIIVSSITKNTTSAGDIGKGALAGASLLLIPITSEDLVTVSVTITWRGEPIASFVEEFPVQYKMSLFENEMPDVAASNVIAKAVLDFLEKNAVMTGAHVLSVIKASDYENDLVFPDILDNFHFQEKYIYPDPFYGVQLRFVHNQFAFDVADVFIYPIRAITWDNLGETLSKEAGYVWEELEYMQKNGHLSDLKLSSQESLNWKIEDKTFVGEFLQTKFVGADKNAVNSMTYLFVKQDKFIKVRASFLISEGAYDAIRPDQFVKDVLVNLDPPAESEFMEELRFKESRTTIQ